MAPSPHSKKRKAPAADIADIGPPLTKKAATTAAATTKTGQIASVPVQPHPTRAASATAATPAAAAVATVAAQRVALHHEIGYVALSLQDIHDKVVALCRGVPPVPADGFAIQAVTTAGSNAAGNTTNTTTATTVSTVPVATEACPYDQAAIKAWAATLQAVLEEFHLLLAVVPVATYAWGTDRSGAADQNLQLLSSELHRSQEQILGRVSPRLSDVLAPVVSVLTDKTVTTRVPTEPPPPRGNNNSGDYEYDATETYESATNRNKNNNNNNSNHNNSSGDGGGTGGRNGDGDGNSTTEVRQHYYITALEDPDYVMQSYAALARNAPSLRLVVLSHFDKLLRAVADYLDATHKDSQHDVRGFVY